jgi:hypothetical protein
LTRYCLNTRNILEKLTIIREVIVKGISWREEQMSCWVFKGKGRNVNDNTIYTFVGCFVDPSWGPSGYNDDSQAPRDKGSPLFNGWGSVNNSLTQVFNQAQLNSLVAGTQNYGYSCANCFNTFYDCINGKCVSSLTGIYASLEECQNNCGGGCPIMGQTEVSCSSKKDAKTKWLTGQGVYFPPKEENTKDEL